MMRSVVVLGHVDCGKSTLVGRLVSEAGLNGWSPAVKWNGGDGEEWEKLKNAANDLGKGSFRWAWATDVQKAARERGISMGHAGVVYIKTKSGPTLTILDAPGHRDFIRDTSMLASVCDAAIVVLSGHGWGGNGEVAVHELCRGGVHNDYEGGFHGAMRLVRGYGIRRVIVVINKLEDGDRAEKQFLETKKEALRICNLWGVCGKSSEGYSIHTHHEYPFAIRQRIYTILLVAGRLGFFLGRDIITLLGRALVEAEGNTLQFIPASAWSGFNVSKPHYHSWYKGPTVLEALESLPSTFDPVVAARKAPIFSVLNAWRIRGAGTVLVVKVQQGTLQKGQPITLFPTHPRGRRRARCSSYIATINSIHVMTELAESAPAGTLACIGLKGMLTMDGASHAWIEDALGAGDVAVLRGDPFHKPLMSAFVAMVFSTKALKLRCTIHLHIHTAKATVRLREILWIGKEKRVPSAADEDSIPKQKVATAIFDVISPLGVFCMTDRELLSMSRFVFRQEAQLIGMGAVTQRL